MKKILILNPKNSSGGSPSYERMISFKDFFIENRFMVIEKEQPSTIKEKIQLLFFIKRNNFENVFISMPEFRNWFLFLVPKLRVILDIRDGWSIAIKSGYGETVKPNLLKGYIASLFEKLFIPRAAITITCTPGLKKYLESLTRQEVYLIMNGYSSKYLHLVKRLIKEKENRIEKLVVNAICAGKFSEYGTNRVKLILKKLSSTYANKQIILKIIGSNIKENMWINDYLEVENIKNISLELLEKMNKDELYVNLLKSDIGVAVIRDPRYEFGTKIFDYILCGIPVFNYFDDSNNFTEEFGRYLYPRTKSNYVMKTYVREKMIRNISSKLMECVSGFPGGERKNSIFPEKGEVP